MKKQLKILLLFDSPYFKPRGYDYQEEFKNDTETWYVENDVYQALQASGHYVRVLGLFNDILPLIDEVKESKPDVVFNLAEVFNQKTHLDKNVVSLLELLGVPYTGASAGNLFICNNKALSKKILNFHKIKVPQFSSFAKGDRVYLPKSLKLPLVIKPLCEEASRGISQASVVDSQEAFLERVSFIHQNMKMDAIAEEYVEGRELYVSVLGEKKITVLPPREMKFGQFPEDEPRIATYKAKWDDKYRKRWGIKNSFVGKLPNGMGKKIEQMCRRAYRALDFHSYARFDMRVSSDGEVYFIEPNANPCIAKCDEVAQSAEKIGIPYNELIQKIVEMPL